MQKIFIKYFLTIMIVTVGLALIGNFLIQTVFSQYKANDDAYGMIEEITRRIEDNDRIIDELTVNLNENYIARAKSFAEIIAQNPQILESYDEMVRITKLLNVEEVHVTDENGILSWGNVTSYYGLDFDSTDQTKPFMPALTDKSFAMAQEPRPNGIEGKLFQYISVARQDKPGIVQVGVAPEILDNALSNNKIDAVISNFNVSEGINVIAFDKKTGSAVGDTRKNFTGKTYGELNIDDGYFSLDKTSGWINRNNEKIYSVYGEISDYLIEVSFTKSVLFAERKNQNLAAGACSILLGAAIIAAIFILLKKKIINDIEIVNVELKKITSGNLKVIVDVKSTPEFVALSSGINQMVDSLSQQLHEITTQADVLQKQALELEESNINILASLKYARKIQNNLLPSSKAFDNTFKDYYILWEPKDVVGGDIYWLKNFDQGSVLCVCDCTGHGTPGALLTMLVVTALDAIVEQKNCTDTAGIIWELEQRLVSTLNVSEGDKFAGDINDGADLAVLFINNSGEIVFSSAKLHIFVCNGITVENIKGQKISIGDGSLKNKDQVNTAVIPVCSGNAYYIVSDGLFEQVGGEKSIPFGYKRFMKIILDNHDKTQPEIAGAVWNEFEAYRGHEKRRDDVTLVCFKM